MANTCTCDSGYRAPEYLSSWMSTKADVFSFGVMVLETVTGQRVLDLTRDCKDTYLLDYVCITTHLFLNNLYSNIWKVVDEFILLISNSSHPKHIIQWILRSTYSTLFFFFLTVTYQFLKQCLVNEYAYCYSLILFVVTINIYIHVEL